MTTPAAAAPPQPPICSSAWATRSATSSRHGAAITCTPIGSGFKRHRHGNDRQADERDRLRVDADVGPQRHLLAVEHEGLLPDQRRDAGRRRREDDVDLSNSSSTRSRYQRRNFCAWTTSAAGTIAPAISRSRTAGSKSLGAAAQPVEMQRRAFGRGDDVAGGARALALPGFRSRA